MPSGGLTADGSRSDLAVRLGILLGAFSYGWAGLWRAALELEDGSVLFARSYQRFAFADWFSDYAGYVVFGKNVLVSLLCRLPTDLIPTAFALSAIVLSAMPALSLLHPAWERVAPRRARWLAALALVWLPLGNGALSAVLDYTNANLQVWLCLLLARPVAGSSRRAATVGEAVLVFVLAWSHPLSFLLLPVAVWQLWCRERRVVVGAFLLAVLTYRLLPAADPPAWHVEQLFGELLPYCVVRLAFEVVCGTEAKEWLYERGVGWIAIGAGCVLSAAWVAVVMRAWRRWQAPARAIAVLVPMVGIEVTAASLLVRGPLTAGDAWGQRYVLLARVAFVLVGLWALERLLGWRRVGGFVLVLALVTGLSNRRFYRAARPSPEFVQFLHHLAAEEQRLGDRRGIDAHLERGDWPIHITPK